ncbi:MAG: acyltransferase family protein, partial [Pyrinomonadaceae bacterium]
FTIALLVGLSYLRHLYKGTPFAITWKRVLLHLGYLNAFFDPNSWLSPVFWTLAIEFQYYLMIGLLYPLVSSKKRIYRIMVLALLASTTLLTQSETLVPHYMFLFIIGIGLYLHKRGLTGRMEFLSIMLVSVIGVALSIDVLHSLVAVTAVAVMATVRWRSVITDFLGDISYSFYLMHAPVTVIILKFGVPLFSSQIARTFVIIGGIGVSVFAAWIVYKFIEGPSHKLSKSIKYASSRKAADIHR